MKLPGMPFFNQFLG